MIITVCMVLKKRIENISEMLATEIKEIENNQLEMKSTRNEIRNMLHAKNNRLEEAEK